MHCWTGHSLEEFGGGGRNGLLVAGRIAVCCAAGVAAFMFAPTAQALNPQTAGLQVALRAYGLYGGAIDGIAGPKTVAATKAFQRRAHLSVTGRAGPRTRRALGPLGAPLFGRRMLRVGRFGWDVSVLQFLLARRGGLVPVSGYFDGATARGLRRYQRSRHLQVDGVAGPRTMAALARGRPALRPSSGGGARPQPVTVRGLLAHWARVYRVDSRLVRALAWMESGYHPGLVSSSGARGVMQVLPVTKDYVETVLLHRRVPWTVSGGIHVGVVYLRQLLREFNGNERLALAGWYQGPASVRRNGLGRGTRAFVADVLALRRRGV
jgi:Transglycosylase SLT domain/Putative peptidoglycan binding domain